MAKFDMEALQNGYYDHLRNEQEDKSDYIIAMVTQNVRIIIQEELDAMVKRLSTTAELELMLDKDSIRQQLIDAFRNRK